MKLTGAQAPRDTVTNANGAFKFTVLLPGDYVVTADLKGLGMASQKVKVFVDNDAQLTLTLVQTTKAEVVVTGAAAEIDKTASEVNFNYTDNTIKDLPLSRTYEGVLKIVPGAAASDGQGFVSISGGTRQDNKYLLDGVNITNPGYGFLGVDTNQLDIADFNVKKGGISAEFGRTSGAMINAVTKSGTNQIAGSVQANHFAQSPSRRTADFGRRRTTSATTAVRRTSGSRSSRTCSSATSRAPTTTTRRPDSRPRWSTTRRQRSPTRSRTAATTSES